MTPDIGTRLQSVVRSLESVLLPAIPADNSLAHEQAQLAIGHLAMIGEQWRFAADYARISLTGLAELARAILAVAEGGGETRAAADALAQALHRDGRMNPEALHRLWPQHDALAAAIDRVVIAAEVDGSDAFQAAMSALVLGHGTTQAMRNRGWFRATGLDPDCAALPGPAALVGAEAG